MKLKKREEVGIQKKTEQNNEKIKYKTTHDRDEIIFLIFIYID